jgi:hypothetical protein
LYRSASFLIDCFPRANYHPATFKEKSQEET